MITLRKLLKCYISACKLNFNLNIFIVSSVPPTFYPYLTPELSKGEVCQHEFDGRNMDALQALVQLLHYRLNSTTVCYLETFFICILLIFFTIMCINVLKVEFH